MRDYIGARGRADHPYNKNSTLKGGPKPKFGNNKMPRATNAPASRERRRRVLRKAKGYRGRRSKLFRYAKDATMKGQYWAYRDRKTRKRNFRMLWIQRLNAAARANGMTYSRLAEGLKAAGIVLDRKILADLAVTDEKTFASIIEQAKGALEKKSKAKKAA
jgi:large subunit ribosomal protein L20